VHALLEPDEAAAALLPAVSAGRAVVDDRHARGRRRGDRRRSCSGALRRCGHGMSLAPGAGPGDSGGRYHRP
jgi:hypothetical protein